jgi:hypothetical protein
MSPCGDGVMYVMVKMFQSCCLEQHVDGAVFAVTAATESAQDRIVGKSHLENRAIVSCCDNAEGEI